MREKDDNERERKKAIMRVGMQQKEIVRERNDGREKRERQNKK